MPLTGLKKLNKLPNSAKKPKLNNSWKDQAPQSTPDVTQKQKPASIKKKAIQNLEGVDITPSKQKNIKPDSTMSDKKSPKLKMFGGTKNLNLSANVSLNKNGRKRKLSGDQSDAKSTSPTKFDENAKRLKRNEKRRLRAKNKRVEVRLLFKELKVKVAEGDLEARKTVEEKLNFLQNKQEKSKTCLKQIKFLQGTLSDKQSSGELSEKTDKKAILNKQMKSNVVGETITNKLLKPPIQKQNEKKGSKNSKQGKVEQIIKIENDLDSDSEEVDEEEISIKEGEEEEEEEEEEEDDDESGEEEQDSDDDEEEASDEEDDEDSEDEDEESDDSEEVFPQKKMKQEKQIPTSTVAINKNSIEQKTKPLKNENGTNSKSTRFVAFVGNLPYTVTTEQLAEHFKKAGDIRDIRIPTDKNTNKGKGFAYVELTNQTSYEKALSLNHTFVDGRRINVLYSEGGNKKSPDQKSNMKAKNFKLQAMRQRGLLAGSEKDNQKRSARRNKQRQFEKGQRYE